MKNSRLPLVGAVALLAALITLRFQAQDKNASDQLVIEVPAAVKALIQREAGGAKIVEFSKGNDDGRLIYEAVVSLDGREYVVRGDGAGTLQRVELRQRDEDKKPLRLDDLPGNVKAALQKLARGGVILEVDMQHVSYSAVTTLDGRKYRIEVDSEGRLLKKEHAGD